MSAELSGGRSEARSSGLRKPQGSISSVLRIGHVHSRLIGRSQDPSLVVLIMANDLSDGFEVHASHGSDSAPQPEASELSVIGVF